MSNDPKFWVDPANLDIIVVRAQAAMAVYRNEAGDIVLRQERAWDEDVDTVVVVSLANARAVAAAILRAAGDAEDPAETPVTTGQARSPGAERQRRYRERVRGRDEERDGAASLPVTDANRPGVTAAIDPLGETS